MALAPNALTTFATVQAECKISSSDQAAAERLINVVSDAIERYCGRALAFGEESERFAGTGGKRLILTRTPVAGVDTVYDGDTRLTDYDVEDAALGFLWRDAGWPSHELIAEGVSGEPIPGSGQRTIVVTYSGGYVTPFQENGFNPRTLPYELEQSAIDAFASLWRRRGADLGSPAYDASGNPVRAAGGILPGAILPTLQRFRRGL